MRILDAVISGMNDEDEGEDDRERLSCRCVCVRKLESHDT